MFHKWALIIYLWKQRFLEKWSKCSRFQWKVLFSIILKEGGPSARQYRFSLYLISYFWSKEMENSVSDSGNMEVFYFLFHGSLNKSMQNNTGKSHGIVFGKTSLKCVTMGKYQYSCYHLQGVNKTFGNLVNISPFSVCVKWWLTLFTNNIKRQRKHITAKISHILVFYIMKTVYGLDINIL